MKTLEKTPPEFSKNLFWDADPDDLDFEKQARWVIARVVMYGSDTDWATIKKRYGLDKIRDEMLAVRYLDERSLSFLAWFFGIQKKQFKCFELKQSNPELWPF